MNSCYIICRSLYRHQGLGCLDPHLRPACSIKLIRQLTAQYQFEKKGCEGFKLWARSFNNSWKCTVRLLTDWLRKLDLNPTVTNDGSFESPEWTCWDRRNWRHRSIQMSNFSPTVAENLIEFDSLSITYGQRIGLALMAWNRVETNGMMKIVKNALMNNQVLSKKYVLLSTGNLSNKWHRDIIVRFFNRNICLLKNRANCPALLDIYVQFSGVGLGTKNCNLKIFWTILLF